MDETFRAELRQASEAWRSGTYVITPLETENDIQKYVLAGKTFWIRADRYWVAYYAAIFFCFSLVLLVIPAVMSMPNGNITLFEAGQMIRFDVVMIIVVVLFIILMPVFRWAYLRQFLVIGPNSVLFRDFFASGWFRWSDVERVKQEWIKATYDDGYVAAHFEPKVKCTLHSGRIVTFTLERLNKDEVKSVDTLKQLFLWHWNRYKESLPVESRPTDTS